MGEEWKVRGASTWGGEGSGSVGREKVFRSLSDRRERAVRAGE